MPGERERQKAAAIRRIVKAFQASIEAHDHRVTLKTNDLNYLLAEVDRLQQENEALGKSLGQTQASLFKLTRDQGDLIDERSHYRWALADIADGDWVEWEAVDELNRLKEIAHKALHPSNPQGSEGKEDGDGDL